MTISILCSTIYLENYKNTNDIGEIIISTPQSAYRAVDADG